MILGHRDLWLVASSTLVFAGLQTVLMGFLVLYLTEVLHLSLVDAGHYLVMAQVTGMVGRVVFGMLSDRLSRRRTYMAGCLFLMLFAVPYYALLETRQSDLQRTPLSPRKRPMDSTTLTAERFFNWSAGFGRLPITGNGDASAPVAAPKKPAAPKPAAAKKKTPGIVTSTYSP
jgi:nitrate/nitrite transporter NarK